MRAPHVCVQAIHRYLHTAREQMGTDGLLEGSPWSFPVTRHPGGWFPCLFSKGNPGGNSLAWGSWLAVHRNRQMSRTLTTFKQRGMRTGRQRPRLLTLERRGFYPIFWNIPSRTEFQFL